MANIANVAGNAANVNKTYKKLLSLGEGAKSDDFRMTFEGYSDIEFLVQATQLPELKREMVETYGPHGVKFNQAGKILNAGDMTITIKEVIEGKAYEFLRDVVKNKKYLEIKLACLGESKPGSPASLSVVLSDAWLEVDALDLSVEDGTTLVKPAGTIHYNWVSYYDDAATAPMNWGA